MKHLNKLIIVVLFTCSSCATILGGKKTAHQVTTPDPCEPKRQIRWAALTADIILTGPIGVAIDFLTGKIYKPEPNPKKLKQPCNE